MHVTSDPDQDQSYVKLVLQLGKCNSGGTALEDAQGFDFPEHPLKTKGCTVSSKETPEQRAAQEHGRGGWHHNDQVTALKRSGAFVAKFCDLMSY